MDINLPLILLLLVGGTGAVWVYDFIFLRKPRLQAITGVNTQFPDLADAEKPNNEQYMKAYEAVAAEPAFVEYSKSFFPVLFLVFFLRSFIIEPFQIPSESMVPTLEVGDFIAVNKFAYGVRLPVFRNKIIPIGDPKRGDVMVFFPPHEDRYFIKRVIGLPGDKIRYEDKVLYVNGKQVEQSNSKREPVTERNRCVAFGGHYQLAEERLGDESHVMRKCSVAGRAGPEGTWVLSDGEYFMMGDNRDNSSDSRVWGPVPEERIVGKAFAVWMHWGGTLPSFSRAGSIK
ncbi:signal peptidase I [Teredinibacter franksiae]|uniref:signal peptidase I n=1 Tax=Teredinibacter franksiae TaxID=2761453 RepID=UPI001624BF47|nr:signal peptidase I [Teredinibacter franksiae]